MSVIKEKYRSKIGPLHLVQAMITSSIGKRKYKRCLGTHIPWWKHFFKYHSRVLLWHQILKRQLLRQMFVWKLLFLVCYFFSVIWNISKLNDLKTKCKLNCQNEFFGKLFLKSGNTSVYFFMFSLLRFIWRTIDISLIVVVKGLY